MKRFTTSEVADKLQLSRETLYQWMRTGQIPEPQQITLGKKTQYLWADSDIAAAKARKEEIAGKALKIRAIKTRKGGK
ncbi:MAG: helix-turn-helix domain-containing protein [Candidatus Acidiferrales bacterium]